MVGRLRLFAALPPCSRPSWRYGKTPAGHGRRAHGATAIVWRTYAQSLWADAVEMTINGHRAAQWWNLEPTYRNSYYYFSCMVAFKTS